jgi:hypothetical protein
MHLRILLGILLAVAASFAPLTVGVGPAMAAAAEHHATMDSSAVHCADQSQPDTPDQPAGKACCAGGCMAAATLPAAIGEPVALCRPRLLPSAEQFHRGTLREIATPPPRLS